MWESSGNSNSSGCDTGRSKGSIQSSTACGEAVGSEPGDPDGNGHLRSNLR